jgi:hypothetical protein
MGLPVIPRGPSISLGMTAEAAKVSFGERTRPRVLISAPSPKSLESSRRRGAVARTRGRVRSPTYPAKAGIPVICSPSISK